MRFTFDKKLERLPPYPKASFYGHEEGIIQLSANENPYPPSPNVISAIMESLIFLNRYPNGHMELKEAIANHLNIKSENIALGCGSNEIIEIVLRIAKKEGRNKVLIPVPSFAFYRIASEIYGYEPVFVPLDGFRIDLKRIREVIDEETRVVFLSNPNNPTGTIIEKKDFEAFLRKIPPDVLLVVDEAYYDFVENENFPVSFDYFDLAPIVTLRTFSKAYGLAGLRIGFAISDPTIISLIEKARQPFSVSTVAIVAAKAALEDKAYTLKILNSISAQKKVLYEKLKEIGVEFVRSETNFLLVRVGKNAEEITKKLYERGIVVRWMGPYGLPEYIRVTVGKKGENEMFIEALKRILGGT